MTQNKKIAVTGGIGSGKSALMQLLKERGYPVYSCDQIAHALMTEREYLCGLEERFPDCFEGGILDRRKLAARVFASEEDLNTLNAYSHPQIMERLLSEMKEPVSFAEVPLLFEGGYEDLFDGVIAVRRGESARLAALCERGLDREEALLRMSRQFPPERLEEKACFPIENDGTIEDLSKKLSEALRKIL